MIENLAEKGDSDVSLRNYLQEVLHKRDIIQSIMYVGISSD
jgi:hypothetical protein